MHQHREEFKDYKLRYKQAGKALYDLHVKKGVDLNIAIVRVAQEYTLSVPAVELSLQAYRRLKKTKDRGHRDNKVKKLYNAGYSQADIARKMKISPATISRVIAKKGTI